MKVFSAFLFTKKRAVIFFLSLIHCCSIMAYSADDPGYLSYDDYHASFLTVYESELHLGSIAMERDSNGIDYVFFSEKRSDGNYLLYIRHDDGIVSEVSELAFMEEGYYQLESQIDSQDRIHLVWQQNLVDDGSDPTGTIHYARIYNGQIETQETIYNQDNALFPDVAVDQTGDAHVSFVIDNTSQSEGFALGYVRQIDGSFQPMETAFFGIYKDYYQRPAICVSPEGTAYILGKQWSPILLTFRNGHFEDPAEVCAIEMELSYADTCQMIYGPDGRVHMFILVERREQPTGRRLIHVETSDGHTFTEPEYITTADVWYFLFSEPQILSDGSIVVPSSWEGHVELNIDRNYGFGNPDGAGGASGSSFDIGPIFRLTQSNDLLYTTYFRDYDYDRGKYYSHVYLDRYSKLEFTEPYVKITSFPTNWDEDVVMNRNETLRVTLDVYNPTEIPIEADLVLMINIGIDETSNYYFVCPDPMFPSFQEEYCGISVDLPAGFYIQNPTIFELDIRTLPESFPEYCRWYWYAALIDPVSGELLSNVSVTWSDFAT